MEQDLPKKKNIGLIITIIILIFMILGISGYVCYKKGLIFHKAETKEENKKEKINKEENEPQEEQTPTEEEIINDDDVIEETTTIEEQPAKEEQIVTEESIIEEKVKRLSENFASYYPISNKKTIKNQDLLIYALSAIEYKNSFTKEEVEESIKNLFGTDMNVKNEDIECPTSDPNPIYLYENGVYTPNPNHGGHGKLSIYANIHNVSFAKKDNKIIGKYKILYAKCSDTCVIASYYKTYKDAIENKKPILEWDANEIVNDGEKKIEEGYQRVKDEIPITTFEFTIENDGTYTLNSIEIN